jgi:hypothetical protein
LKLLLLLPLQESVLYATAGKASASRARCKRPTALRCTVTVRQVAENEHSTRGTLEHEPEVYISLSQPELRVGEMAGRLVLSKLTKSRYFSLDSIWFSS